MSITFEKEEAADEKLWGLSAAGGVGCASIAAGWPFTKGRAAWASTNSTSFYFYIVCFYFCRWSKKYENRRWRAHLREWGVRPGWERSLSNKEYHCDLIRSQRDPNASFLLSPDGDYDEGQPTRERRCSCRLRGCACARWEPCAGT